ncbi:MAG: LytTR family transcriptional regulator DNA-binding domain-containing protein [Saprospiraceae bacterium]|nr:LytTR family transcriptional regulator DNA-binding domain-containing protein [Saprospiraceae bacterium]
MKFENKNLPVHLYKILYDLLIGDSKLETSIKGEKKIGFIQIEKLELAERILLRKMISEYTDYIVIISSDPKIAQFAWKVGAFHFMEFPFTIAQLKVLKQKFEEVKLTSKLVNKKIRLGYTGGYDFIPLCEINIILGQGDYVTLYRQSIKSKTYTYRISKIEKVIESHFNFIKLTKSIIININNVAQISGNLVKFTGNPSTSLELSPRAIKTLKDELLWIKI